MLASALFLLACGPEPSTIEGSVAGHPFNSALTAYYGGRYLFLANKPLDCMDVDWVDKTYQVGVDPAGFDVVAAQFTFNLGSEVNDGFFNLSGRTEVGASALVIDGGGFSEYRVDEGELVIDEVEENAWAFGTFDLTRFYDTDEGSLSATFSAEWCVNLPD